MTGALGPIAALMIYFVFRDRSRYVAYHALQSFVMQLILWVGGGALVGPAWVLTGLLSAEIISLLCMHVACVITLLPLGALVYGVWAALRPERARTSSIT
ncbi:MAG: DUF4870 domain-containing protein [Anaerolineales bacterium]|nr:DUF4870 domain-containing protein [Anaerolineales bacterium]